jgi:hypothetical protein
VTANAAPPRRIQLSRAKGWLMPPNTVKVDRTTPWGNIFVTGVHGTQARCVDLHRKLIAGYIVISSGPSPWAQDFYRELIVTHHEDLRGKNVACWCHLCPAHKDGKPLGVACPDCAPCHADTLLEVANGP